MRKILKTLVTAGIIVSSAASVPALFAAPPSDTAKDSAHMKQMMQGKGQTAGNMGMMNNGNMMPMMNMMAEMNRMMSNCNKMMESMMKNHHGNKKESGKG